MKNILKQILKYYLKFMTQIVLLLRRPTVIAIAGDTNKTFVKNEIKKVLKERGYNVRANPKNFNTEIGLPLAILYLPSGYNYYTKWLPTIYKAPLAIFQKNFPDYLVLELGSSDAGDMKYLLSIVKPKVSIITDITRKYLHGFSDMNELVGEYRLLAQKTNKQGLLILNNDNTRIRSLAEDVDVRKVLIGFKERSNPQIINIKREEQGEVATIKHNEKEKTYNLDRFGQHHVYALTAGLVINNYFQYDENKKKEESKK